MSRLVQPSLFLLAFERSSALSAALCTLLVATLILYPANAVSPQVASDLAAALHVDSTGRHRTRPVPGQPDTSRTTAAIA